MSDEISLARGWTLEAYVSHNEALRVAEEKFQVERDRRYSEVALEREKALKIKETADETARILVAANQAYRDEKANDLRSQIEGERGNYGTKADMANLTEKLDTQMKPLSDYVAAQSGPRALTPQAIFASLAALGVVAAIWFGARQPQIVPVVTTPTVTVTTPAP